MADLRNCSECGRLFAYQGRDICTRCMEGEDEEYMIVRRYVREHPGASVFEVADETGIEEEKILQFLKDGRLQSKGFAEVHECQMCGRRITAGKYCENCIKRLDVQLKEVQRSSTDKNIRDKRLGMHIKE
ncbi:MAG: TIGR03826 family flagellar region protein [Syntrophomonadaceae bacterium]|mgnify:CR=1 FL=1|jgi:flagellar operon protein (TIGR03826 family)